MGITGVYVDSREPKWVQDLKFGGAETTVTALDYGDVWVMTDDGCLLVIERKTPSDFLGTLKEGRLFPQMAGLVGVSRHAYVFITDDFHHGPDGKVIIDRGETGFTHASVWGTLLSVQELGVMVVFCAGDQDFENAVMRLANRSRDPEMVIAPVKTPKVLDPGETVLAALPGIGYEKATALLDFCSTPALALAHLSNLREQVNIRGIGNATKAKVREALGLDDGTELAVIRTSDRLGYETQLETLAAAICPRVGNGVQEVEHA